jgi:cell division protein FtsZ
MMMSIPSPEHPHAVDASSPLVLVGIGGGGSSAVSRMREGWADGPTCVVVDTDAQALETYEVDRQIAIGRTLTQGLGAGGQPDVGKIAAQDDIEALRDVVRGRRVVILNVALGGGTGTGAAPVVGRVAHEMGALVLCFVTLPFRFEGEDRTRLALHGLRDLRMFADAVVVQPNDLLLDTAGDSAMPEAFLVSDTMLGVGVRALWRLLTRPGLIRLSFADIRRVVDTSGKTCAFGYGMGKGPNRVTQALDDLCESPMLDHGLQLAKSASLLVQLVAGADITLMEIEKVMNGIREQAREGAHVVFGVTIEPEWKSRLGITLLCSEEWPVEPEPAEELEEVARLPAEEPAIDGEEAKAGAKEKPKASRKKAARRRALQAKLAPGAKEKGRFQGVEPTFYEGQDLDIPTYLRRGIVLSDDDRKG